MSRETLARVGREARAWVEVLHYVLTWASLVDLVAALALTPVVRSPLPGVIAAMLAVMMLAAGGRRHGRAVTR